MAAAFTSASLSLSEMKTLYPAVSRTPRRTSSADSWPSTTGMEGVCSVTFLSRKRWGGEASTQRSEKQSLNLSDPDHFEVLLGGHRLPDRANSREVLPAAAASPPPAVDLVAPFDSGIPSPG
jgi:hypothetical protein